MMETVEKILAAPHYQRNIEYGESRSGHPEGKIEIHIVDLENNLERLSARGISSINYWKLKLLIHVHDSFKGEVDRASPFAYRHNHETLAREYASQFTDDADLLNMLQYHDENYCYGCSSQRLAATIWDSFKNFWIPSVIGIYF